MIIATIIDRGRGPEIAGTRITVYRIMDFLCAGDSPKTMAEQLGLTAEQVQAALEYIASHHETVDADYQRILARVRQENPLWVDSILAKSSDELRERIMSRIHHAVNRRSPDVKAPCC